MNSITTPIGATASGASAAGSAAAKATWRAWAACTALAALWFAATAWLRPLAIPDEGRYAGVAWEMLRSGNWLVPTLNGAPFFHKPPLFYWITAASMDLLGVGVWSARTASILAASAAAAGLFAFVRRWAGRRLARDSVIVLTTMPLFYGGAQYANLDMLVAACITGTILLVAHAALTLEAGRPHRTALCLAFVAAAAGVLAKGLIGAVLPALVLLGWGLASGRARQLVRLLLWAPGWLVFVAIGAPWFIAMQWRFPDFAHYFFVVQHLQRFVSVGFNNPQPAWFYPVVLFATTLPWSPWALVIGTARYWHRNENADLRALMLVWLAVVTVFFSVPDSKLVGYILPALPPLALVLADAFGWVSSTGAAGARWRPQRTLFVAAAAACVAVATAAHFYQPKSMARLAAHLKAGRGIGEPVLFLGNYYYDIPFYAQLEAPVSVADPWAADDMKRDSWRRELADAERFAPPATPRRRLGSDELGWALCGPAPTWIVGPWPPGAADASWLASAGLVYREANVGLWRVRPRPAHALDGSCKARSAHAP